MDRFREIEIDPAARKALSALSIAIGITLFFCGLEELRLHQARSMEIDRLERLRNDELHMSTLRAAVQTVTRLSRLAESVRAIRSSGARKAAELAEIADLLPPHAWLTSLHQEGNELTLQGDARSYNTVSDAMERLSAARMVENPLLLSSGMRDNLHPDILEYEMRLRERTP